MRSLDDFYTGSRQNVDYLFDNLRIELLRHGVTSPLYVEGRPGLQTAYPALPIHQHDPVQTTKTSVIGAIDMLGLAKQLRISSSAFSAA